MITKKKLFFSTVLCIIFSLIAALGYYMYGPSISRQSIVEFKYARDHKFITDVYEANKYWLFEGDSDVGYLEQLLAEKTSLFERAPYEKETIKVLFAGCQPVGFVTYCKTKFYEGKIRLLGVDAKFRGQGYGYTLLKHAVDDLVARGAKIVYLVTRTTNYPAHKIYKKAGFKQTTVHDGIVRFDYYV